MFTISSGGIPIPEVCILSKIKNPPDSREKGGFFVAIDYN
jgi:hypothetical protein